MIQSIQIECFKAFSLPFRLELDKKSQLIYGANGAGKTSIFEALKVVFFNEKLSEEIDSASTPEEQEQYNQEYWSQYNNSEKNQSFKLEINDEEYKNLQRDEYSVFLLSIDNIKPRSVLNFKNILKQLYFDCDLSIEQICNADTITIQDHVNDVLFNDFREDFKIEVDPQNDFDVRFKWESKNINTIKEYQKFFNEAKINLVTILICLSVAELNTFKKNKKNVIVLDDVITSLDVVNRSHLLNYVFERLQYAQIIFFTHNINLFNLALYIYNDSIELDQKWDYKSLYEYNGLHQIISSSEITSQKIRESLDNNPESLSRIGNEIRQRFEVLLYKISHLLLIGSVEESNNIINRIESRKVLYYNKGKTADDLVDEIVKELRNKNDVFLRRRINFRINNYKKQNYQQFLEVIRKLKIFRKITLHPMSHGVIGRSSYTVKEINFTLDLLDKFESYVKNLSGKKVDGM